MIKNILRGRLFGHPIHSMLIHFPIALFIAGVIFDYSGLLLDEPLLWQASRYTITLGVVLGFGAAFFGFIDYIHLENCDIIFRKASLHATIQATVLIIFLVLAVMRWADYPNVYIPSIIELSVEVITLAGMLAGNYLGGELVFTHGIGVGKDDKS